jgi:precorrin-3B synthase
MESGDGLIVRVKPRAGTLSLEAVRRIAEVAQRCGNGHIDLTRRANLQIRGVKPESLPPLQAALEALGLLDATPEAEAVRNIMTSPLAGADSSEVLDVRPIARALEELIASEEMLWRLPGKFGFVVDGGGALALDGERADIRLAAIANNGGAAVAVGIDRPGGPSWLGWVSPDGAAETALAIARAFLETQPVGSRTRLRDADSNVERHIRLALAPFIQPIECSALKAAPHSANRSAHPPPSSRSWRSHASHGRPGSTTPGQSGVETCVDPDLRREDVSKIAHELRSNERPPIGELRHEGDVFAVGVAAPFGRVEADMLLGLADAAATAGASEVRLSPWRSLYVPVSRGERSDLLLAAGERLGFIVEAEDPLLGIEACPGAPACRSATLDTRAAARVLASLRGRLRGISSVHVSGCAKGCACSAKVDLVLVGQGDRFGILVNARADGAAEAFVGPDDVGNVPGILDALEGASRHG